MAETELWKVTSFIVRHGARGAEVLLLRHPFAGLQFPAGTVEAEEAPADALPPIIPPQDLWVPYLGEALAGAP